MGGCFSCKSSPIYNHAIRIVHLNGNLDYIEPPVTVGQVIANSKYFLCTAKQLLTPGSRALKFDAILEPGLVYFLLPYSILCTDVSPMDMATLVRRLGQKTRKIKKLETRSLGGSFLGRQYVTSPICASPARSFLLSPGRVSPSRSPGRVFDSDTVGVACGGGGQRASNTRSWKPNLDPIREKSFNRGSESDLKEQYSAELSTGRA